MAPRPVIAVGLRAEVGETGQQTVHLSRHRVGLGLARGFWHEWSGEGSECLERRQGGICHASERGGL